MALVCRVRGPRRPERAGSAEILSPKGSHGTESKTFAASGAAGRFAQPRAERELRSGREEPRLRAEQPAHHAEKAQAGEGAVAAARRDLGSAGRGRPRLQAPPRPRPE